MGYKLLSSPHPMATLLQPQAWMWLHAAVAAIYGKGSEASKVGPIWYRPPFALVTTVASSTCEKAITTARTAHNHISSSTTQVTATNSHMTRKLNAHQFLLYAEMVCVLQWENWMLSLA